MDQEMDQEKYDYLAFKMVQSFSDTYGFANHHETSFENYIHFQIKEIIKENSVLEVVTDNQKTLHLVKLESPTIGTPVIRESNGFIRKLSPKEAIFRKCNYLLDVFINVRHELYKKNPHTKKFKLSEVKLFKNVLFFQVPCMRNSSACNDYNSISKLKSRGTFIINGYEKCLITQEKLKTNYPYVFLLKKTNKYLYRCEVRSSHPDKIRSTSTLNIYMTGKKSDNVPMINVSIPFMKNQIPIVVIFRLLGINKNEDIIDCLTVGNLSKNFIFLAKNIVCSDNSGTLDMSEDDLYNWIGMEESLNQKEKTKKKRIQYMKNIFENEFFPHCVTEDCNVNLNKSFFLSYCIRKLIHVYLGELPVDDIDSYMNKRNSTTGTLLALLTRQLIRNFLKTVHVQLFKAANNKHYINVIDYFLHRKISSGLKYAFTTGNWGIQKGCQNNQAGVCQVVNTMNINSKLSHLRQVNTPINRDGKQPEPRQLHTSHYGILCAPETPEGKSVGLLNSLSLLARIRIECPSKYVIQIITEDMGVTALSSLEKKDPMTMVLVNGIIVGYVKNPLVMLETYRLYRSWHSVPIDSSISYKKTSDQIFINTDGEDCFRPLICLKNLHKLEKVYKLYRDLPHFLWNRLLIEGVIENINKEEESELYIVVNYSDYLANKQQGFTHMEIHPSFTLYGIAAGAIPFSNHNQAPRNIYQAAMGKQAISSETLDFHDKMDNKSYSLVYPQKPIVSTWTAEIAGYSEEPTGQAVVVAIQCFTGFNQEDSLILNQAALDRGLFRTAVHKCYKDNEVSHGTDVELFGNLSEKDISGKRNGDYSKLSAENGLVDPGVILEENDAVIGKTIEFTNTFQKEKPAADNNKYKTEQKIKDRSTLKKTEERERVEKVLLNATQDGLRATSIRTIAFRSPEIGDKLSSCHGQKGIIGMILPSTDMPFNKDGIVPDVIMNCHAVPSRMTIGQLIESLFGKLACAEGKIVNGTAFRGKSIKDIQTLLEEAGMEGLGKEIMYDGKTGRQLKNPVFMGVTYYQRLRHMVQDKIHGRSKGAMQILTRQPVEGRSRKGGFRLGEMERDSLISHGVSSVLIDRFLNHSDRFDTVMCETCGILCEAAPPERDSKILNAKAFCRNCQSGSDIVNVSMPYPLKLLTQELQACHINLKFEF